MLATLFAPLKSTVMIRWSAGILCFVSMAGLPLIAEEAVAANPQPGIATESVAQVTKRRELEFAVTAGFGSVLASNDLLKNNKGAEIGLIATLPLTLWKEDANLVTLRGQYTDYANGIETPSPLDPATNVKLTNAGHSQLRMDFRQIFTYWDIQWSVGLGMQLPVTSSILTPRGEFTFADAKSNYPAASDSIAKIDRSFAGYLRLGIDQKILSNALIIGIALELTFAESPKTEQRALLNIYAGARIW